MKYTKNALNMFLLGPFSRIPYQDSYLVYCQRDSHATSQAAIYGISHKAVVLRYIENGFRSFWLVLLVVVGGFGWILVVLAGSMMATGTVQIHRSATCRRIYITPNTYNSHPVICNTIGQL